MALVSRGLVRCRLVVRGFVDAVLGGGVMRGGFGGVRSAFGECRNGQGQRDGGDEQVFHTEDSQWMRHKRAVSLSHYSFRVTASVSGS